MREGPRRALRIAKLAFTPLAVGFLVAVAWQARESFAEVLREARPGWLAVAVGAWMSAHLCSAFFTRSALLACGSPMDYSRALQIHVGRLPARYLPGGVWHTVARLADFRAQGVPGHHLAAFVLLENALAVASAFVIGGTLVATTREPDTWRLLAGGAAAAGALALALTPVLVARIALRGGRLARERYGQTVLGLAGYWCLAALAFACYALAFPAGFSAHSVAELAGTYLLSWGVGFLAVFAPQGIGVFEAVAGEMLRGSLGLAGTVTLVAGFRVCVLAGDLLVWALIAVLRPGRPD